jgi:nitroreductase
MAEEAGLFEIIHSTRAMRRLKPDPVPRPLIETILRAGQAAPSGGNAQNWGFLVVEDAAVNDEGVGKHYADRLAAMPQGEARDKLARQVAAVRHLTERFHEAPVWIVPCLEVGPRGAGVMHGASIYPAVQNMLLAARALGLGATLTCRHLMFARECDALFGLPEGVASFAILPVGWPEGKFGPVARGPLEQVVYRDRWGTPYF